MGKVALIAIAIVILVLIGGGIFLAVWDIPSPSKPVEKVIPDARFPR
jgi:hypothetical protein